MDTQWNTIDTVGGYFDSGFLMDIYGIIDDFSRSEDIKENTISIMTILGGKLGSGRSPANGRPSTCDWWGW